MMLITVRVSVPVLVTDLWLATAVCVIRGL